LCLGEEYTDFAKHYATNKSLNQLKRKAGDGDRVNVPESISSSSIGFQPNEEAEDSSEEELTIVISNVRSLCPDYRHDEGNNLFT